MPGVLCTIVVTGELDDRFNEVFDGLTLTSFEDHSVLAGPLSDDAQLHGVLRQLFDLGLEIVSLSTDRGSRDIHPGEDTLG